MELGKYKLAMRPKKYLTREFVVYKAAPEAMDDVITEEQNTIDTMPSQAPVIDNYMPEMQGMEDPSLRQVELADGGTPAINLNNLVQTRFNFQYGGPAYLEDVFKEAIESNNYNIDDIAKKAAAKKAELYNQTKLGTYKIPTLKQKIEAMFKRYVAYKRSMPTEDYVKYIKDRIQDPNLPHVKSWNQPLKGTPLEAKGKGATKNAPVTNLRKAEKMLSPQELKQWRAYTTKQMQKAKYQRKFQTSERFNPETGQFEYDPTFKQEALGKKYLRKNIRRAIKADAYKKLTASEKEKYLDFEKRLDSIGNIIKENPNYILQDKEVMSKLSTAVDPQTGEIYTKSPTFTDIKKRRVWEVEHIDPVIEGQTQGRGAFLRNLQVLPEPIHKNFKNNAESFLNKHYGDKKYQSQIDNIINKAKELKVELRVKDVGKVGYKPTFTNFADKAEDIISTYVKNPTARTAYTQATGNVLKSEFFPGERAITEKLETIDTQVGEKKIKTIVENIGCPTGSLKAANGANCYIKGAEKIQAGKLNQNEFNVLQKAVKSPAVAKAVKYGGVALKGLGALFAPLMVYDTYTEYKKGKPISEALEYGLLGTNIIGGTRDELKLTPREREARGVQQQYEREQQDVSGLSSDFYFPSDLSVDQAAKIYEQGQDRVAAERAAEEKQAALENVYQGDPGILDYSEYAYGGRVGLAAGTIPRAVNWVAKRIQDINKLIKTKRAKAEDFLDEIEILNKAEELNLTKEQVGQILRQQKQASTEKYLKRPIEGDPDLESRLPYDPNATPRNIKRGNFEKGGDPKDKPILPINPMMDEGPQDPSKRTFIQGAGGVGLAGLLLGTGLLKLGKSAAVSSKIGSMVKNTTAPSWMEALITKVMKEGTDISAIEPKIYTDRFTLRPRNVVEDKISVKELQFKNPETGKDEIVRLRIDETQDSIYVDYIGDNTLAGQGVTFKLSPKEKIVDSKDGKYLTSEKVKGEYQFSAHESEPRVVNWDGDIEFDGETGVRTIIDLNSDISGLKSFVTGGKGVDKKVAKLKKETVDKIEKNPGEYLEDAYDANYYDPSLPTDLPE
jgi:hypothetical protein